MDNQTTTAPDIQSASECASTLQLIIAILFFAGLFRIIRFLRTLLAPFIRRRLDLHNRYNGGWAILTGGS